MNDAREMRGKLAQILRENSGIISEQLERKFVEEYPAAEANNLNADLIHRWTLAEIELIARAVEEDDSSIAVHKGDMGRIVSDHDLELTKMASSLATTLFIARRTAPVIYLLTNACSSEGDGQEMLLIYEKLVREVVTAYCSEYISIVGREGAILRTWDLLSGLELDPEPEQTPAKKHKRVAVSEGKLATGAARPLWEGDWLTSREKDVLKHLVAGKTNGEIAAELDIKQNTVKNYVARIFSKFGVGSRAELLAAVLGS